MTAAIDRAIELHEQALAAAANHRWEDAVKLATEARDLFYREDGPLSPDAANLSNVLSQIAMIRAEYAQAEAHARTACDIMRALGDRCSGVDAETIRVEALGNLGAALRSRGRYAEAEPWLKEALARVRYASLSLVPQLNNLAVLYKYTGRFEEAEALYREALAETSGDDAAAATIYHNFGGLYHSRQDFAVAEPYARRACEIRERLLGPDHVDTIADRCALAGVLDGLGRYGESEAIYRRVLIAFAAAYGERHLEVAVNLNNLAGVRWALGDPQEAEFLYLRALEIKRELLGDGHADTALTLHNYASMLEELGRIDEARPMALSALRVFEATLEDSHPRIAVARALCGASPTELE
jgi:tetratricopeptide (TPR) repeat protein